MRIFVDENIPLMTVTELRSLGHDVHDIRGTVDEGMQDDALWDMAQQEERILITTDKGFTHYRMRQHHGVLVIQLRQPNRRKIHARIMQALTPFSRFGMARFASRYAGHCPELLACSGPSLSPTRRTPSIFNAGVAVMASFPLA